VSVLTAQLVELDSERRNTVDHLQTVSRDVQQRLATALAESGHHSLRPSFGPLLERLRDGAMPVGQVATALNVSPQAASRAALALEKYGYVARATSAADGRSRVVALTSRGEELMTRAAQIFAESEHAYGEILGGALINRIRRMLGELRIGLEHVLKPDSTVLIPSTHSIGSVILISLWAKRETVKSVNQGGHHDVRRSHVELLRAVSTTDVRMSDIARELGVTRQAVSATVQELVGLGYVERRPDATDARAVLIAPSTAGFDVLDDVASAGNEFEARCRAALGRDRWSRFAREMAQLAAAVAVEQRKLTPPALVDAVGPNRAADLASLAEGLRSRLGPRQAARLGALLTTRRRGSSGMASYSHPPTVRNR
jgi:DNA-binding MarR family transcriptional regulator